MNFSFLRYLLLVFIVLLSPPSLAMDEYFSYDEDSSPVSIDLSGYFVIVLWSWFHESNNNPTLLQTSLSDWHGKVITLTFQPNQSGQAIITTWADGTLANCGLCFDDKVSLRITVNPVNDAPVANPIDPLITNEDIPIRGMLSATDIDNSVLTYHLVKNGYLGRVTIINPNTGEFVYKPYADVNGTDSFSFKANDGSLDSNVITVGVTVNAVNDAPFFIAGSPPIRHDNFGGAMIFKNWAIFNPGKSNEKSQTVLTYSVSNLSDPSLFVIPPAVDNNGTLTYTLTPRKWGSSTFQVTVQDDGGVDYNGIDISSSEEFTISVMPYPLYDQVSLSLQIDGSGRGQVSTNTGLTCQSEDCQDQPDGSRTCNPQACSQMVKTASEVKLMPQAEEGSDFSGWGGHLGCVTQPLFMGGARLCIAHFRLLEESLTLLIEGQGHITAPNLNCLTSPCTISKPYGTALVLQAQPAPGWQFEAWTGDCSGKGEVVMTAAKRCGAIFVAYDEDLDHIPSVVENQGPNNGDGNGDGILDSQQENVTSFLDAINGVYLTLQADKNCPITNVYGELPDKYPGRERNHLFPQGLIYFELGCSQSQVTLYYHAFSEVRKNLIFYKFGPTVPGDVETLDWYQYPATFAIKTVAGKPVVTASYTLTDGKLGDSTEVDGKIVDPAGLGLK